MKLTCKLIKEQLPIQKFLSVLGHFPTNFKGEEAVYFSPYRNENTPSFFVNLKTNLFFDFGSGEGGDLIKLAQVIYANNDIGPLLQRLYAILRNINGLSPIEPNDIKGNNYSQTIKCDKISIQQTKELGNNPAITEYIISRGIQIATAKKYCKEVYYSINDKHQFGIGNQNENGWAIRNRYWKGCSRQGLSKWQNGSNCLYVFEGIFDMLSLLEILEDHGNKMDFLVLNSLSNIKKARPLFQCYEHVSLMLDRDEAGQKITQSLIKQIPHSIDHSHIYEGFKDMNEFLLSLSEGGTIIIRNT